MSQFSGKQFKGAMRTRKATKRKEAELRNDSATRLLKEIFESNALT